VLEATEEDLARAQLTGGELLLSQGKAEEARKSLEKIREQPSAKIFAQARLLLARCAQKQKKWEEAAGLYKTALADSRVPVKDAAGVYFRLGICQRELNQPREAAESWKACVRLAGGDEGPAGALLLADVRLLEPASLEGALEMMTLAVDGSRVK